jgi:hypothetical protein
VEEKEEIKEIFPRKKRVRRKRYDEKPMEDRPKVALRSTLEAGSD